MEKRRKGNGQPLYRCSGCGSVFTLVSGTVLNSSKIEPWRMGKVIRLMAHNASLDEMRPIRYIEHPNTKATITPFVGKQIEICEAFGFEVPDGCAPEYAVRKTSKGKRGRPRKNKLVVKEED